MGKKSGGNPAQDVINQAKTQYNETAAPTPLQNEMATNSQTFMGNYNKAVDQQTKDYSNVMGAYQDFRDNLGGPTKFSYQNVHAQTPQQLTNAYGNLDEGMAGYRNFAATGGYSPTDVQDLRARGIAPIRAAYGNTMRELDRSRALGGNGGAPNYIAALSKANRELPGQMADEMSNVNAGLAESIRAGKEFGLQGETQTGSVRGGLASGEAQRQLQADLANQGADLQAQGMGEQSLQNLRQSQLASMGGQASLYGTTPGQASTFGNQALNAYQTRAGMDANQANQRIALLNTQLQGYSANKGAQGTPWWQKALGIAGQVLPFFGGGGGSNMFGGGGNNGSQYLMPGGQPEQDGSQYLMPGGQPDTYEPIPGEVYGGGPSQSPYTGYNDYYSPPPDYNYTPPDWGMQGPQYGPGDIPDEYL
jgi:hypothetical protein